MHWCWTVEGQTKDSNFVWRHRAMYSLFFYFFLVTKLKLPIKNIFAQGGILSPPVLPEPCHNRTYTDGGPLVALLCWAAFFQIFSCFLWKMVPTVLELVPCTKYYWHRKGMAQTASCTAFPEPVQKWAEPAVTFSVF